MKKVLIFIAVMAVSLFWGCSKQEVASPDLRNSLQRSVAKINSAARHITGTDGYSILTAGSSDLKSEMDFKDSISLDLVKGVYDFKPDFRHHHMYFIPYRLFERTGDSGNMIVNMPYKLAVHPWRLHNLQKEDTEAANNFTIDASDYHYYYSWFKGYDYKIVADFILDSEDIGNIDICSEGNIESGRSYSSKYTFVDGYGISAEYMPGDSTVSSFALTENDDVLLKETIIRLRRENEKREIKYVLTVGNIDIVRGTGIDSIQVYLDGVLQQEAGAIITDSNSSSNSICHHRDILLTFDDGTTANLSELIKPAKEVLATLFDSLHSMNFATNVVNYIAISIYYHN